MYHEIIALFDMVILQCNKMIKFLKQNQLHVEENAIPFYILSSNMLFKEDW